MCESAGAARATVLGGLEEAAYLLAAAVTREPLQCIAVRTNFGNYTAVCN